MMSGGFNSSARLYYFQGNFYWPFLGLSGSEQGRIKKAIREFSQENKLMIQKDRSSPEYKSIIELIQGDIK